MEPIDSVLAVLLKDAALPGALAVVLITVLRWGLTKVDAMIVLLRESLERTTNALSKEQETHDAIMQALSDITHSQTRIVETLQRIETRAAQR